MFLDQGAKTIPLPTPAALVDQSGWWQCPNVESLAEAGQTHAELSCGVGQGPVVRGGWMLIPPGTDHVRLPEKSSARSAGRWRELGSRSEPFDCLLAPSDVGGYVENSPPLTAARATPLAGHKARLARCMVNRASRTPRARH